MKLYKEEIKSLFLKKYEENTQEVYKRIFKNSSKLEEELHKELCSFNEEELEKLIREYIKPTTGESARTYLNVLSKYIQWGIENNFSTNLDNPIRRRQDYYLNFVKDQSGLYLSKDEIDAMVYSLYNAQDSFIILALFNGIQGTKLSELINLTVNDINEDDNVILVKNSKGRERIVPVDKSLIKLALQANKESEYAKRNGEVDYSNNIKDVVMLPTSKYILKPTVTSKAVKKVGADSISHSTVYNRLEMIKSLDEFEEYNSDALTTKNIVRSGMLWEAKKILDNGGELSTKSIKDICEKFGMNYKWSIGKDFLNEKTVNEVYS